MLLRQLEQVVQANAMIDARQGHTTDAAKALEGDIHHLTSALSREVNALTAELLKADLIKRQRTDSLPTPVLASGFKKHTRITRQMLIELAEHCDYKARVMAERAHCKVSVMRYHCKAKGVPVK